jgi:hypothetical protein
MDIDTKREEAQKIDQLFHALVADVFTAKELLGRRNDGFSKRVYIKTFFNLVEGIVHVLKTSTLFLNDIYAANVLTPEEIVMLKEEQVHVTETGKVSTQKASISLLPNLRFAIDCFSRVNKIRYKIVTTGVGWAQFKNAAKIRDHLTHPQLVADLEVLDADMQVVNEAVEYFRNAIIPLIRMIN